MRLLLALALLYWGTCSALAQGSIAVGTANHGGHYPTIATGPRGEARPNALKACQLNELRGCQIVQDFTQRCAAVVVITHSNGTYRWLGSEAPWEGPAREGAVKSCTNEFTKQQCNDVHAECNPITASFLATLPSFVPSSTWNSIALVFGALVLFGLYGRRVSRQQTGGPAVTTSVPPTSSAPLPPPTEGAALRLSIEITKSETKPFDARGIFYKKIPVHELKVSTAFSEVARVSVQESGLSDMTIISAPFPWSAQGKRLLHEMGQQVPMQNYPLEWFINNTIYIPYDSLVEAHAGANKIEAEFRKVKDAITIAAQPKSRTVEL